MNVLLITTDQQKASTLGAYGDPLEATPHLDALAARGTTFTCARTQNPFCMPARAAILTGTYPSTNGVVRNGIDLPPAAAEESVAKPFADGGYATSLFGKAHFASYFPDFPTGAVESVPDAALIGEDWFGPYFGFEHVELTSDVHNIRLAPGVGRWNWGFGPPPMGLHYGRHLFRDGRDNGIERLRLMQPEADGSQWGLTQTWRNHLPEEEHHTSWIADRAIEWLDQVDRPFFCWVSFPDPHHPFDPPSPWCDRYRPEDMREVLPVAHPGEFAGKPPHHQAWTQGFRGTEIEWANPGWALFSEREQLSILAAYWGMIAQIDSSIGRILAALAESGRQDDTLVVFTSDHGDFMGEHQMILKGPIHYRALLQVPLVVAGPGVAANRVVEAPVGTVDLAPTLLSWCGLEVPAHMEGASLFGPPRSHVLTEDDVAPGVFQLRTLTSERFRITHDMVNPANSELYDLVEDPGELHNRWSDPALSADRDELLEVLRELTVIEPRRFLPQVCSAG